VEPPGGEFVGEEIGKPDGDTDYREGDDEAVAEKD
jgi:hypothetical protein